MPFGTSSPSSMREAVDPEAVPQIELVGLRKVFTERGGDVVAVDGADLTVRDGELFAMLGPSGSGKTTVLRMIAGFEQPTAGTIRLGGTDVTGLPARLRDVNTVFQEYALFPHMTVAQNVEYGMRVRGVAKSERRRRTSDALDMVRLADQAATAPRSAVGRPAPARRAGPRARRRGRACCCSTSRSAPSTSSCASRCSWSSRRFNAKSASRSSSSPTTRTRR